MSTNDKSIKGRIRSVRATMQITKAMQLVASSKFRKAEEAMRHGKEYSKILSDIFGCINGSDRKDSVYIKGNDCNNECVIMIAGDRGLAGGFNNEIFRLAEKSSSEKNTLLLPLGRRAYEYALRKGLNIFLNKVISVERITEKDCSELSKKLCGAFKIGELGRISVIYTKYKNALIREPVKLQILPLKLNDSEKEKAFEPDPLSVLDACIPEYVSGMIYCASKESYASELSARRSAMDSANQNASEMIDSLMLEYNRARQASITQEITEIVAGAEG